LILLQPIFKEIQIGVNSNHLVTPTQFPIQPITIHIVHRFQSLTFHNLAFNSIGINYHGFIYTTLFLKKITYTVDWKKIYLKLINAFQMKWMFKNNTNFHFLSFSGFHKNKHTIIQCLNTLFIWVHYENGEIDHNCKLWYCIQTLLEILGFAIVINNWNSVACDTCNCKFV
jgi:hypothetical protein